MHFHEIWCSFSGVVDASVCVNKTFFFFFYHPSRTSEIKQSAFWSVRNDTTLLTAVSFPKNWPLKMPPSCICLFTHQTEEKLRPRGTHVILTERVKNSQDDIWPHDPSMQLTDTSKHIFFRGKITERLLDFLPVTNTTINQKWPLIMIMEEVMLVIQKVQENQKKQRKKRKILHAVTEADIVSNRVLVTSHRPCLLCSHSTQHALQTTQL